MKGAAALIDRLRGRRCLFVLPHPDDEVHSCVAFWRALWEADVPIGALWVTTGSPPSDLFTRPCDFETYRKNRALGFYRALELLMPMLSQVHILDYRSREVAGRVTEVRDDITRIVCTEQYDTLFVCPFEGAHPDHDVLNVVIDGVGRSTGSEVFEYASYYLQSGQFVNNAFRDSHSEPFVVRPTAADLEGKQRLRAVYVTEAILARFVLRPELLRVLPCYERQLYATLELYYETWPARVSRKDVQQAIAVCIERSG